MLILRGNDEFGSGAYQASRGSRHHNGLDVSAAPGATVYPRQMGVVTRLGYPYAAVGKQHFRYVQITDDAGNAHRYFYVVPAVQVGDRVALDTAIGVVQDLTAVYPGMGNHVHYEVIDNTGRFVDPGVFLGVL